MNTLCCLQLPLQMCSVHIDGAATRAGWWRLSLIFRTSPSASDSNTIGVSLNDDLGVPKRSPAGWGSTCEGGPINVVHIIFIICGHHDLFLCFIMICDHHDLLDYIQGN